MLWRIAGCCAGHQCVALVAGRCGAARRRASFGCQRRATGRFSCRIAPSAQPAAFGVFAKISLLTAHSLLHGAAIFRHRDGVMSGARSRLKTARAGKGRKARRRDWRCWTACANALGPPGPWVDVLTVRAARSPPRRGADIGTIHAPCPGLPRSSKNWVTARNNKHRLFPR